MSLFFSMNKTSAIPLENNLVSIEPITAHYLPLVECLVWLFGIHYYVYIALAIVQGSNNSDSEISVTEFCRSVWILEVLGRWH